MKTICMALFLITVISMESSASGQLIPRRNRTRPSPTCKLPSHQYKVDDRSRPITAFSDRFVYFDNPMELLDRATEVEPIEKTEITTVTTEKQVSSAAMLDASKEKTDAATNGSSTLAASETSRLDGAPILALPGKITEKVTTTTQSIKGSTADEIKRDKKLFQWRQNMLKIDHCEISNMAVQLSRNGDWVLNLRADQNRNTGNVRYNPTLFIKRNQFGIVLRCYGNMETTPPTQGLRTGKPVLVEIKVDEFWVQNGKPEFLVSSKNDPLISQNFDLIDRVAIEFFYYK